MRIDRLKIHKYKNLVDCEFDFSNSDGLLVIAGINGSGKSNLLEAILLIMKDVCSIPKPVNVDWPLYEISFAGKNEALTASRDSIECESPRVVRELINGAGEVVHEQPSVVYMYSGEFNRIYNSRLGYVSEAEMSRGFYSITAEDLNVATIVLAIKRQSGAIRDTGRLITLPKVSAITFHSEGVNVSGESGPDNEFEDLSLWLSQQAEVGGKIFVHIEALSDKLAQLGAVDPRDQYYVLSQIFEENGPYGFSSVDIGHELPSGVRMSVEDLSEGEKRLLLLRFVYEVLGKDGPLILLDEPDAHVHESRRIDLYSYLEANSGNEIFTICTSHSPSIVNAVQENSLIGLRLDEDGKSRVVEKDAISTFRDIADERMGYFSTKPIVLFEGKIDIAYVSTALKYFKREDVLCRIDFLTCGGSGDMGCVYNKLHAMFPNRQFRIYCDRDSGGLVAMKALSKLYGVVSDDDLNEEGCPQWKNCSEIPPEIISKLEEKNVLFLPHPFDKCSDYAIEDYFSRDFLISTLEAKLREQNGHMSLKSLDSVGEQVKKKLYAGVTTIPDSEKHRFAPIVRSIVGFYNKAYRNETIDVSFIVPIVDSVGEEDVDCQLDSLERAKENLSHVNNLKCTTEILAISTCSDVREPGLAKYRNVIPCPNANVEKAIWEGVHRARGDYIVVIWQKSIIQETLLKGILAGLNSLPDFMLFDTNCGCQEGEFFDLSNENQARKAFAILNKAIQISSLCISRRFILSLSEYVNLGTVFSDRIGLSLLFAGMSFWAQTRSVSRWCGSSMGQPSIQSDSEADAHIKAKFDSWLYRKEGSALFFSE